jgi:hypothetical protein
VADDFPTLPVPDLAAFFKVGLFFKAVLFFKISAPDSVA